MNKVKLEYINYNPNIHQEFPLIRKCKVYTKDNIINVSIEGTRIFNEIIDDIGYDNLGKYISITIGQWHHIETGRFLPTEDFFELTEFDGYLYEYVSILIKIYSDGDYRACYHNDFDKKFTVSFIPYKILNFNDRDSTMTFLYNLN